jgi:hypothetical protein
MKLPGIRCELDDRVSPDSTIGRSEVAGAAASLRGALGSVAVDFGVAPDGAPGVAPDRNRDVACDGGFEPLPAIPAACHMSAEPTTTSARPAATIAKG